MDEHGARPSRAARLLLDLWPLLLSLVLTLPLVTGGGYPLARDLVFVPRQPLNDAAVGLTDSAPRAVPLDAILALLSVPLDGAVLARLLVPGALVLAGWGTHRLVGELGLVARLAAGGFAVWNPFVVERLALGQWALLMAYAALPWIVLAARRRRLAPMLLWTALASVTPTGGLLAVATAVVCGTRDRRSGAIILGGGLMLQLPWVLPVLMGAGGVSADPNGVDAFAADTEGRWGVAVALLGLGGIWDARSEPASRLTFLALVSALVVVLSLVAGLRPLMRAWGRGDVARLVGVAAVAAGLAVVATLPAGRELLRSAMVDVPGTGLLRDGQKLLAPAVVLVAAAFGGAVQAWTSWCRGRLPDAAGVLAALGVLVPLAIVADAPTVTWPTVRPLDYPSGFDDVSAAMPDDGTALVTLPWRSYRRFEWGHGLVSSDPATRWFDREVVVSDDLAVGDLVVSGESERSEEVGDAVASAEPDAALGRLGVGWVLVYRDDPMVAEVEVDGLRLVHEDAELLLYAVPGAERVDGPSAAKRTAVSAAYAVDGLLLLGAGWVAVAGVRRRRGRASQAENRVRSET